jgi:DNA-binding transcriptional ArsR family regulator
MRCREDGEAGETVITVRLSSEDLSQVRFAFSPLLETVMSFRVLLNPGRHALHLPWAEQTRGKLADLELAPFYALVRPDGYLPDFLVPTPLPTFDDEMARLSETPGATVVREIAYLKASEEDIGPDRKHLLEPYLMDPKATLRRLDETLLHYHEVAVAPHWPRLRVLLEDDVLKRAQALAFGGPEALFDDLHPSVRYREGSLAVEKPVRIEGVTPGGRGILLVTCAFAWPKLYAIIEEPWQPSLVYAPRGAAKLWISSPSHVEGALEAAPGLGRASVLKGLAIPRNTTELARQLGLSPGTTSEHLSCLRRAGLVEPLCSGRSVFYRLGGEGKQLLGLFGERYRRWKLTV